MAINKVIYGGETLLDLTGDTVTADKVADGYTFHDKSGALVTGTSTLDSDTSDATATTSEILSGKTAYIRGQKVTGDMTNNGSYKRSISAIGQKVTIPQGYHDGSGYVDILAASQSTIIPSNIREGVNILGVVGTMSGSEGENPQDNKDVTPSNTQQVITPDSGYTCLRQVTVSAIPYTETPNTAGGTTVTIA